MSDFEARLDRTTPEPASPISRTPPTVAAPSSVIADAPRLSQVRLSPASSTRSSRIQRSTRQRVGRVRPVADVIDSTKGGEPLSAGLRQSTEEDTGADLAPTRVHRGSPLPAAVGARAFTYGTRIFLGPGQDDALAHEARHVAQQRLGRVRRNARVAGLAANLDLALERDADERGPTASDVPASSHGRLPVVQGIWITPDPNRPNDLLDTDTKLTYRVVRYTGDPNIADVRLLVGGLLDGPVMQLRLNPDRTGVLTLAVDPDEGSAMEFEMDAVDDTQQQQVDAPAPFEARTSTPTQQAERQLTDMGMRLARLVTGFTCQLEVAPVAQGQNVGSDVIYTPDQLLVVRSLVGKERPDTYLEPEQGKSNIPQGKHTIAWALMRRWFESLAGRSVRDVLLVLAARLEADVPFVLNDEGEMLRVTRLIETDEVQSPRKVIEEICKQSMRIHVWQRYASELLRLYAQIHHQSISATVRGKSKQRGEAPAVALLRESEDDLAADQATFAKAKIEKATADLIEVTQHMEPAAYAAAVAHWIELLVDAFPRVMEKFGSPVLDAVLNRKLAKTYLAATSLPEGATMTQLLGFYGHAVPADFGPPPPRPQLPASRLIAAHASESQLSAFVGNVAVSPVQGAPADAAPAHQNGPIVRWERCTTLEVFDLMISDDDRPKTKYKQGQQSHTVAWTLWRNEVVSFRNRPVADLLAFLRDELRALVGDVPNEDMAALCTFGLSEVERVIRDNPPAPLHMWQADLSRLLTWYAHIHQKAASATYHDPRTARASGHGEAKHMAVLRRCEERLYNSNERDAPDERVVDAAVKLMDVHISMKPATVQRVIARWRRALQRSFPRVIAAYWDLIRDGAARSNVNTEAQPVSLATQYPNAAQWLA